MEELGYTKFPLFYSFSAIPYRVTYRLSRIDTDVPHSPITSINSPLIPLKNMALLPNIVIMLPSHIPRRVPPTNTPHREPLLPRGSPRLRCPRLTPEPCHPCTHIPGEPLYSSGSRCLPW